MDICFSFRPTHTHTLLYSSPFLQPNVFTEHVFVLNAPDAFLSERVRGLPQSVAEEMGYTREAWAARLSRYRQACGQEETLWDYFDELEIHPEHIGEGHQMGNIMWQWMST